VRGEGLHPRRIPGLTPCVPSLSQKRGMPNHPPSFARERGRAARAVGVSAFYPPVLFSTADQVAARANRVVAGMVRRRRLCAALRESRGGEFAGIRPYYRGDDGEFSPPEGNFTLSPGKFGILTDALRRLESEVANVERS